MLRSLARTEPENYPAWPSIDEGVEAKRELERSRVYYEQELLPMAWRGSGSKVKLIVHFLFFVSPTGKRQ